FTMTEYTKDEFINTSGGPYSVNGNLIMVKKEFDTYDKEQTGTEMKMALQLKIISSLFQVITAMRELIPRLITETLPLQMSGK
ncbi:MAG: hypothetical protein ABIN48_01775, partial [Ginsengibacter sp.]